MLSLPLQSGGAHLLWNVQGCKIQIVFSSSSCRVKAKISRQKECQILCITGQIVIGELHLSITCVSQTMTV